MAIVCARRKHISLLPFVHFVSVMVFASVLFDVAACCATQLIQRTASSVLSFCPIIQPNKIV